MSCTDTAKYFPLFQSAGEQFCDVPRHFCFWTFCPKVKAWSVSTGPQLTGSGEAPNKHFGKHFCRLTGQKFLSVFTLELLAKNASVATLALLAVKERPLNSAKYSVTILHP